MGREKLISQEILLQQSLDFQTEEKQMCKLNKS
jgi:hypothetical protein